MLSQVRKRTSPSPFLCISGATITSMPQDASISCPSTRNWTGIVPYWPTILPSSRAIQILGSGAFGFWRYCQSHRAALASARAGPNTRLKSASTSARSSGRYVSTITGDIQSRIALITGCDACRLYLA
jgi:hypothetical protein